MEGFLSYIETIITDARDQGFSYSETDVVPNVNDAGLTYESGSEKKGKEIKTCVLYVDIRDSVNLVKKHHFDTMGKIYIAFTRAIIKAAHHHNGHIRNIIGDRIMIVFPQANCCTNSVNCAITINQICRMINSAFSHVDFKAGIGVDYGEMRVLKVGVKRKGTENITNKNLIWVGYPANRASRLTDVANKKLQFLGYDVSYQEYNLSHLFSGSFGLSSLIQQPQYIERKQRLNLTEFADKVKFDDEGKISFGLSRVTSIKQIKDVHLIPPILVSEAVFNTFKTANPDRPSIINNLWTEVKYPIKDIENKVFGSDLHWVIE